MQLIDFPERVGSIHWVVGWLDPQSAKNNGSHEPDSKQRKAGWVDPSAHDARGQTGVESEQVAVAASSSSRYAALPYGRDDSARRAPLQLLRVKWHSGHKSTGAMGPSIQQVMQ